MAVLQDVEKTSGPVSHPPFLHQEIRFRKRLGASCKNRGASVRGLETTFFTEARRAGLVAYQRGLYLKQQRISAQFLFYFVSGFFLHVAN
jgi:hypothetical protein